MEFYEYTITKNKLKSENDCSKQGASYPVITL